MRNIRSNNVSRLSQRRETLPPALRLLTDVIQSLGWSYGAFIVATVALGLTALLPPELFRYFTQSVEHLSKLNGEEFLVRLAIFGTAVAAAMLVSSFGNTYLQEWLRLRIEVALRRRVLTSLHRAPLTAVDTAQRGDWLSRMTGDLGQTEMFIADSLPMQLRQLVILFGTAGLFLFHSGWVATIPLGTAIVLCLFNIRIQRRLAPVLRDLRTLQGGVFQSLIESLEGIRTIRSHSVEPYFQRRFDTKLSEISDKSLKVVRSMGLLLGSNDLVGQLMVTASLTVVSWALIGRHLTVGEALFYPFFIGLFYGAVHTLAGSSYDWNRFLNEGGRLAHLIYQPQEPIRGAARFTGELIPMRAQSIKVHNLHVGHVDGKTAGPIQFELKRGDLQAVMGPSGCGKTTFMEVIAGLRPALAGNAEIVDDQGRSLWQSGSQIQLPIGPCAYVEQHPYIFEGSLRENLSFGNSQRLSDTVLWNALERTALYEFTKRVGGLDYFLRDRGRNLSEGERYRIALCRALLLRRPFLLLDEPFAALDESTIELIVQTLETEKARTGIMVVTHYLPAELFFDGITDFLNLQSTDQPILSDATVGGSEIKVEGIAWSPSLASDALANTTTQNKP